MAHRPLLAAALALCALPGAPRAQDVPFLERRLLEVHSLLLDLPPVQAPGAPAPGQLGLSLELVTIPFIDGDVGTKREQTASDHTRLYPRPRLQLGLGLPLGLRAFAGAAYIPPVEVRRVTTHYGGAEAGLSLGAGPLRAGLRAHAVLAVARAPVTTPDTRDRLEARLGGLDAAVGLRLGGEGLALESYAGAGVVALRSRFHVTVDGTVLRSDRAFTSLHAGLRLQLGHRWEAVAEADAYPGRLTHLDLRLGWLAGP